MIVGYQMVKTWLTLQGEPLLPNEVIRYDMPGASASRSMPASYLAELMADDIAWEKLSELHNDVRERTLRAALEKMQKPCRGCTHTVLRGCPVHDTPEAWGYTAEQWETQTDLGVRRID